ncbi:MAG: phage holin family protein [Verrucomicrobiae bacterium]|nr:phage holin family protein [Verrucomicrobiae bacterium]
MPNAIGKFLQRWLVTTLGVLAAVVLVPGIDYDSIPDLLVASLLLGALNAFARPLMVWLTLPLVILSLGLFVLVINALLLYAVGYLLDGFHVAGFWPAFFGGLVISVVSMAVNALAGSHHVRVIFKWRQHTERSDTGTNKTHTIDLED